MKSALQIFLALVLGLLTLYILGYSLPDIHCSDPYLSQVIAPRQTLEEKILAKQLDSLTSILAPSDLEYWASQLQTMRHDSLLKYLPSSELRLLIIAYPDYHDEIVVPRTYLETMIQAQIKMQDQKLANRRAEAIKVAKPHLEGPYWWTHSSLKAQDALSSGALFISWQEYRTVWERAKKFGP